MKIFGYRRPRDFSSEESLRRFLAMADASGFEYLINKSYAKYVLYATGIEIPSYNQLTEQDLSPDAMLVAIGGDGTFLEAVQSLKGLSMPVAGINLGRLGFLASLHPRDFTKAVDEIRQGNLKIDKLSMLTAEGDFPATPDFPCALNDFTIHRHTADMIDVAVRIDGHLLAVVRGDGVIISTPTGSTAYSMSAGGPIAVPHCECFVCTAIAPHNFSVRPLIVPDTSAVELEVRTRGKDVLASLDNSSFTVHDGARFTIKKSEYSTFFAHLQNISFYDTLRDKLMWGLDRRDAIQE